MLAAALTNILGKDNRGDRLTEVLRMAAWGEQGILDRQSQLVLRWRTGALSECDLPHEPGVGTTRTYQPGEMLLSNRPRPGLRSTYQAIHQK